MRNEHVVHSKKGWKVKREGEKFSKKEFKSKDEAIKFAENLAIDDASCAVVHGTDGKIDKFDCPLFWQVLEKGTNKKLGEFKTKEEAFFFAFDYIKKKEEIVIVEQKGKKRSINKFARIYVNG